MALNGPGGWLLLCGVLLNAGAPPFSAWIADAYPEGLADWHGLPLGLHDEVRGLRPPALLRRRRRNVLKE